MRESLLTPKEWAKISKKIIGRTQHNVKNRFICVLSKELDYKREKIRDMMQKNTIFCLILQALKKLRLEKQEIMSFEIKRHYEENEFDQVQIEKDEVHFVEQDIFNVDDFINCLNEEIPSFY